MAWPCWLGSRLRLMARSSGSSLKPGWENSVRKVSTRSTGWRSIWAQKSSRKASVPGSAQCRSSQITATGAAAPLVVNAVTPHSQAITRASVRCLATTGVRLGATWPVGRGIDSNPAIRHRSTAWAGPGQPACSLAKRSAALSSSVMPRRCSSQSSSGWKLAWL